MLLGFFSILIMAAVTYAYWREGLLTAATMCVNVFLAGLVAFNFFEPIADQLDQFLAGTFFHGYEDSFCLVVLFCLTLGLLRLATNNLASKEVDYPPALLRGGGVVFGLVTGYLVSGFLVCVLQTLPWDVDFLLFDYRHDPNEPGAAVRRVLPADRVWLGLMHRAGAYALANNEDPAARNPDTPYDRYVTFDKYATFEVRYARHRRWYVERRKPMDYQGDFEREVHKK